MSENTTSKITFLDFHEPSLKDGEYNFEITQKVLINNKEKGKWKATKNIYVSGERFSAPPQLIQGRFPPNGNAGNHTNVLPHILFSRSTFPWEREADSADTKLPWIWLLVFDEDDLASGNIQIQKNREVQKVVTFQKETSKQSGEGIFLKEEPGEKVKKDNALEYHPSTIKVININKTWANETGIIPSAAALKLMTHVRVSSAGHETEMAACMANRLPAPGKRTFAHLVSLENRYSQGNFHAVNDKNETGYHSFISLSDWSFSCSVQSEGNQGHTETFKGLMQHLDSSDFKKADVPIQTEQAKVVNQYIKRGAVSLLHHLRTGGNTASWYHGPFISGSDPDQRPTLPLPIRSADQLLRFEEKLGMLDTAYAAAWELGRMLTLNNKPIASRIAAWKRKHSYVLQQEEHHIFSGHLPIEKQKTEEVNDLNKWPLVKAWFEDLALLKPIPFNYLVPEESLLPVESIRFFQLDNYWISCLLDGAFSIGRISKQDHRNDQSQHHATMDKRKKTVSGVILRSQVVSGWSSLQVDGSSSKLSPEQVAEGVNSLPLLRMERLGPDILLCLFEGPLATLDIHLKPESLHFGFDRPDGEQPHSGFYKEVRNPSNGKANQPQIIQPIRWWKQPVGSQKEGPEIPLVDLCAMSTEIRVKLQKQSEEWSSAQFALQMIEGVQRMRFEVKS